MDIILTKEDTFSNVDERKNSQREMTKLTENGFSEPDLTHPVFDSHEKFSSKPEETYKSKVFWNYAICGVLGHVAALYGLYLVFSSAKYQTTLWAFLLYHLTGLGITAGAHRLWSHHSYKAKLPLKVMLIIFHSMAFQFTMFNWVRDHRAHHKFVDTNADPYNAKRGLFFSHMGWLFLHRHPDVIRKRRSIYMQDLIEDPVVQFQKRHFFSMAALWCFVIPTIVPMYFWGETLINAFHVAVALRAIVIGNFAGLINSFGHYWGNRPYNKFITPVDNSAFAVFSFGDSWHNYHHTFPWDYKSAEVVYCTNFATSFIDFFAKIGWAYDLKTASSGLVHERAQRTGESTHLPEICEPCEKDMAKKQRNK